MRQGLYRFDNDFHRLLQPALQSRRACSCRDRPYAIAKKSLRENGRRRRAVSGRVGHFRRHFANHLSAHVLKWITKFDFLGNRYSILRDDRRAEFLFEHGITALRAKGDLYGVCEGVHAA